MLFRSGARLRGPGPGFPENRMACGVGACLGCVSKDGAGHHVQVCTQGPVFWAGDVQI